MAIIINSLHKQVMMLLDPEMDEALANGVLDPENNVIAESIPVYTRQYSPINGEVIDVKTRLRNFFKNISASLLKTITAVTTVNYVDTSSFINNWVNYGQGYSTASYQIDINGRVYLGGLIKDGTIGAGAFVLPESFRPVQQVVAITLSGDAIGRVDILTDGTVVPMSPSSNTWVSLEGISFASQSVETNSP